MFACKHGGKLRNAIQGFTRNLLLLLLLLFCRSLAIFKAKQAAKTSRSSPSMTQQIEKQLKLHVAIRHIVYTHLRKYACPIGGTAAQE